MADRSRRGFLRLHVGGLAPYERPLATVSRRRYRPRRLSRETFLACGGHWRPPLAATASLEPAPRRRPQFGREGRSRLEHGRYGRRRDRHLLYPLAALAGWTP